MERTTYRQRQLELGEKIGSAVSERMLSLGLGLKDLTRIIAQTIGLARSTTYSQLHSLTNYGSPKLYISSREGEKNKKIKRLELLFHALKFRTDDPLIGEIKEMYPNFNYSPKCIGVDDKLEETIRRLNPEDRARLYFLAKRLAGEDKSPKKNKQNPRTSDNIEI